MCFVFFNVEQPVDCCYVLSLTSSSSSYFYFFVSASLV